MTSSSHTTTFMYLKRVRTTVQGDRQCERSCASRSFTTMPPTTPLRLRRILGSGDPGSGRGAFALTSTSRWRFCKWVFVRVPFIHQHYTHHVTAHVQKAEWGRCGEGTLLLCTYAYVFTWYEGYRLIWSTWACLCFPSSHQHVTQ